MNQSKQIIFRIIVEKIDMLRFEKIEIRFQWVFVHENIENNELTNHAIKHVIDLRSIMNKKNRWEKKDTKKTTSLIELFNVKSISKKIINKLIKNEWMQKWVSVKKKKSLYQVMKTFNNSMLKIHKNAKKWMSALLVQMRIQKIDFNKFLYEVNVLEFDTSKC